jgi:hypothetical protein
MLAPSRRIYDNVSARTGAAVEYQLRILMKL